MSFIKVVQTTPFAGQKPGTSGLRKKVVEFMKENYTENFIQATFDAVDSIGGLKGCTLVVSGDGRYLVEETLQLIIRMARANEVGKLFIGTNGVLSTPAVSAIIRNKKAKGGLILTASHNPGGPKNDFGIKYNIENGGPAPAGVTEKIYEITQQIKEYKTCEMDSVDLTKPGNHTFDGFSVEVIDSVDIYLELMKQVFDFDKIKQYLTSNKLALRLDCMHGAAGPYATRVFEKELGVAGSVVNGTPLKDFGGGHPDPNLVYAEALVKEMATGKYDMGAAFDGDADRNMVLGKNAFFITPSDSVAVIAANAEAIPFFKKGLKGVARSMPTGAALDLVAKKLNVEFNEVPTGWKYFGNLMDADRLSICGEESFGTGSDHIREKDGVWAVLAWLSIMAHKNASVEEVMTAHWEEYGRNFFTRYDYEEVESDKANAVMAHLRSIIASPAGTIGKKLESGHEVADVNEFEYTDPVDGSVAKQQGIRIIFTDGSRIIFRLSGTGSSGATIRMYVDSYINDKELMKQETKTALKPLVAVALELSRMQELTGRENPTVIT